MPRPFWPQPLWSQINSRSWREYLACDITTRLRFYWISINTVAFIPQWIMMWFDLLSMLHLLIEPDHAWKIEHWECSDTKLFWISTYAEWIEQYLRPSSQSTLVLDKLTRRQSGFSAEAQPLDSTYRTRVATRTKRNNQYATITATKRNVGLWSTMIYRWCVWWHRGTWSYLSWLLIGHMILSLVLPDSISTGLSWVQAE